ncbi:Tetratricopeptide repeat-containing domain [Macleaya cordata]|uniref:Tetratricopeptide repeat-containing domain n=1 Tax=Macleaya cordata TaxID=56857 RepID=A0A200R4K0_MACCD|nr:Tetratricopeptide repeat-containing domain [Macleaya cordata]
MGGVKVAATCLNWSQHVASQSPSSSSHTFASTVSSTSSRRRSGIRRPPLVCRMIHGSNLFGTTSTKLLRTQSCEIPKSRDRTLRRAVSTSSDGFSDEEFAKEIQELALRFHLLNDQEDEDEDEDKDNKNSNTESEPLMFSDSRDKDGESSNSSSYNSFNEDISKISSSFRYLQDSRPFPPFRIESVEPPWVGNGMDPPDWEGIHDMIPASIERKANSLDIPLSLRILKRKNQWEEEFREAGESAYCSVKKAFSSMVFIIREIHSYTLQMREFLFYEDLQGILARVQKEMHASFVWLFQQIFSHTPTLMVYVMILLANFTVHSMAQNAAIAAPPPTESYAAITEIVSVKENENQNRLQTKFDISSSGKMTIVGGNKGGGGNVRSVASSGTDGGDGSFDGVSSFNHHQIVPDEVSKVTSFGNQTTSSRTEEAESGLESESQEVVREDEVKLWNSIVEEASRMQHGASSEDALDHETMQKFVSPVKVEIESDDYSEFFKTELMYQQALSQEPSNPLLLSNYAQFLYLVVHDHDRAEEYFKRATRVEPADADALGQYANFLWMAKKDIEAAEERYLEAIEADPGNMFHAGNYAHFLWNTGGVDTCYPLGSLNDDNDDDINEA